MIGAAQGSLTGKEVCRFVSDRLGRKYPPRFSIGTRNKNSSGSFSSALTLILCADFSQLGLNSGLNTLEKKCVSTPYMAQQLEHWTEYLATLASSSNSCSDMGKSICLSELQFLLFSVGLEMSFLLRNLMQRYIVSTQ